MIPDDHLITPLLRKCRANDRVAQKELYKLYYGYAMGIALRYAGNRQDALEIMNDGFMKVFQYVRKFKMEKSFRPWFRRIIINCAIDHFKRSTRQVEMLQIEEGKTVTEDHVIEGRISYVEMLTMVQQLPQTYRTVFNLIAIEGYSHREVAELLQISTGTSKSNYHRARQKLQQLINEYFIER